MTTAEFSQSAQSMLNHLRPYAMRLTQDKEDANDLLQETMIRAFNNLDKFRPGTNLRAWLYTIMKNIFITNYQKMVRKKTFVDTTDNFYYLNTSGEIVNNKAEKDFMVRDVSKAVTGLKEDYRLPLKMYLKGFKYDEIAEEVGIPVGTVKNRIHVARQKLRKKLSIYRNKSEQE